MARKEPLQGYDVKVSVIGTNGPELVGEYQEASVTITNDIEEYVEMGERIAMQLDGVISIEGELKRGCLYVDAINRIYGQSSLRRGDAISASPRFTIMMSLKNKYKGHNGKIRIERALFNEWALSATAGKDVVSSNMKFKAEGISQA